MIKIIYTKEGESVNDFELKIWAKNVVKEHKNFGNITKKVSSEMMITMLRVFIKRGIINKF